MKLLLTQKTPKLIFERKLMQLYVAKYNQIHTGGSKRGHYIQYCIDHVILNAIVYIKKTLFQNTKFS